jgi:hypothetical protein
MIYNNQPQKIHLARFGYHPLFGNDVDIREKMSGEEALHRFDNVWERELRNALLEADRCDPEDALRKLPQKEKPYFVKTQEHREFICRDGLFVAQLKHLTSEMYELTQLWFIRSSNVDPRTLFIKFGTVSERSRFRELAERLGWDDYDLGKQILLDFMEHSGEKGWQEVLHRIRGRKKL